MELKINIEMGNSAFGEDEESASMEAARILKDAAIKLQEYGLPHHGSPVKLYDINGNAVGYVELIES